MPTSHATKGAISALITAAIALTGASAAQAGTTPGVAGSTVARSAGDARLRAELTARAEARATGRPVTVDALTTPYSLTTALADGSFTTVTSALPTRVRSADGSWSALPQTSPPSVVSGATINFTEVQQGCPTYNDYDSSSTAREGLGVGNVTANTSCPGAYRAYYQNGLGGIGSNDTILSSTINISELYSALRACGVAEPITVVSTTAIPDPSSWYNQPSIVSTIATGTVATDGGGTCGAYSYDFNITSAVAQAAAANATSLTWGLRGNETTANTLVRFNANPTITTTYDIG